MCDKSLAVALVWAWLAEHPEYYCSWVNAHTQIRYSSKERRMTATRSAGHWRRLACWAKVMPSLACVCKFERIVTPRYLNTPPDVRRERWDESGDFIPRRYRVLVWV